MAAQPDSGSLSQQAAEGDASSNNDKTAGLADWMEKLPSHFLDVPLHNLAIPGSHNSGSYELRKEWGLSPDADQSLKNMTSIPLIGPMALDIILRWSKCQSLSVLQQLKAGVRFLDFRVAYHTPTEELYVVHSFYGPKVSTVMEEVKTFLDEHKDEVVLMDFNHFYDMELENHLQLITYLLFVFDGVLCPYSSLNALTLRSMREKGQRAVIFYQDSSGLDFGDLWPKHTILSAWANTMKVEQCLAFQQKAAAQWGGGERFHVCQAVLTPDTNCIVQKFGSGLHAECAQKINGQMPAWVRSDAVKGCCRMVYTVDFVEEGGFVQSVVDLNK
ncbi:PI-PLC X domain-containing protein 3-like [Littorina saxatilis]|uniref:Phosphatidylinositol-specific phospholipase C X domain-containing protein n=1 Tax=Littorina saxatilis TaxID=31220 RepID=A0AAN9GGI2_9CAEN